MGVKGILLATSVFAPAVLAQSSVWGQCGGIDWTGPTTCAAGSVCTYSNPWYSQCLPGSAPVSSSSTPSSTKPITTSTSKPGTTSSTAVSSSIISSSIISSSSSISSSSTTKTSSSSSSPSSSPTGSTPLPAVLWATHYSGTISTITFSRSGTSYSLVASTQTTCGSQPSWLTYDPLTKILYCVDESNFGGTLSTYSTNSNGALSQTAKITVLNNGVHTATYGGVNGDSFLAIAHYQTSQFSTYALPITSTSKALQAFKFSDPVGPVTARQDADHPHMALVDPTGTFMLIPDLGADRIRIYSINTATGILTSCGNYTAPPGTGPRHGTFFVPGTAGGAGTMLYVGNELANTVSAFAVTYSGTCISLALTQNQAPYPNGIVPKATTPNGVKVGEVRVKGKFLHTSNRADNSFGSNLDSMALFDLSATGAFTFENLTSTYGSYPRTFAITKAGDFVAIGNQNSATVVIVKRDLATGVLGPEVGSVSVGSMGTDGNGGLSSVIWME